MSGLPPNIWELFTSPEQMAQQKAAAYADALRGRQQVAAQNRGLSMVTSLGANPLLAGITRSAGEAAGALEAQAGQEQGLLAQAGQQRSGQRHALGMQDDSQRFTAGQNALARRAARENLEMELDARERAAKAKAEADAKSQGLQTEEGFRKEFNNSPISRAYHEATAAFDKVQRAAAQPSAANDLALIFGYMKTLDPGSTVREGEFANAQNAGGVDQRVAAMYNRVLRGERLTDEQRMDFIRSATSQYAAHKSQFQRHAQNYMRLAQQSGLDPSRVVMGYDVGGGEPAGQVERTGIPGGNLELGATPGATPAGGEAPKPTGRQKRGKDGVIYEEMSDGTARAAGRWK